MRSERTLRWTYRSLAVCTVLGLGLMTVPASAGGKGQAKKTSSATSTVTTTSEYLNEAGTSDPTNVPIVLSDLDSAVAVVQPEDQIAASPVWSMATGAGVVVAVLDGGFNLRAPAIAGNLMPGYDAILDAPMEFADGGLETEPAGGGLEAGYVVGGLAVEYDLVDGVFTAFDDVGPAGNGLDDDGDGHVDEGLGHGTFVAGMVLRAAPDATILPIRVRDNEGYGLDEWVIRGFEHAIAQGADVINLSIQVDDAWSGAVSDMARLAAEQGITLVVSSGNGGNANSQKMNDFAWEVPCLVVGAVDNADHIAPFTDYRDMDAKWGKGRMVFAPGVDLHGPIGTPSDDATAIWSGTSFAAPLVSGGVALLLQCRPELQGAEILDRVFESHDPAFSARGKALRYCGRVNIWRAVTE